MENEFRAYLEGRKVAPEEIDRSISAVNDFEGFLAKNGSSLSEADLSLLDRYISLLIKECSNSEDRLVAIARYCRFTKKNDYFIHIAGLVNAREVLPGIAKRLGEVAGEEVRLRVFDGFEMPPLGAPQEAYPHLTRSIIQKMEKELSPERCKEVLTWNYHEIPIKAFLDRKERFDKMADIDEFLKDEHRRFVDEISRFMNQNEVWYEQEITPEVVEFVANNQEISVGRRHGDRIFVTKIPFAPKRYLEESHPRWKRYYACHCPLARTSILEGDPDIPPVFCYCSAGFEKLPFDVIFGEPVEIEMLESALKGDLRCRFTIKIPEGRIGTCCKGGRP